MTMLPFVTKHCQYMSIVDKSEKKLELIHWCIEMNQEVLALKSVSEYEICKSKSNEKSFIFTIVKLERYWLWKCFKNQSKW